MKTNLESLSGVATGIKDPTTRPQMIPHHRKIQEIKAVCLSVCVCMCVCLFVCLFLLCVETGLFCRFWFLYL